MLLNIDPDYVKVDQSIIHQIDIDVNRQKLLENLVSYAKMRSIKVVAEGIETLSELEMVIFMGVDYLQGYYIGMPSLIPQEVDPQVKRQVIENYLRYQSK